MVERWIYFGLIICSIANLNNFFLLFIIFCFMKYFLCNVMCNVFILKLIVLCLYIGGFLIGFWFFEVVSFVFVLFDLLYIYISWIKICVYIVIYIFWYIGSLVLW